jgi:hypothetical protein
VPTALGAGTALTGVWALVGSVTVAGGVVVGPVDAGKAVLVYGSPGVGASGYWVRVCEWSAQETRTSWSGGEVMNVWTVASVLVVWTVVVGSMVTDLSVLETRSAPGAGTMVDARLCLCGGNGVASAMVSGGDDATGCAAA